MKCKRNEGFHIQFIPNITCNDFNFHSFSVKKWILFLDDFWRHVKQTFHMKILAYLFCIGNMFGIFFLVSSFSFHFHFHFQKSYGN
jgi:hypothetical protein